MPVTRDQILDDSLVFTGRLGGGLLADLRRRLPHYSKDYSQGFHPKVLASVLFLFFACLANAIAFGGLTSIVTDGQIGTVEMILATAAGGVLFAIFSGQPLTILGGTGPIVIFTGLLYTTCQHLSLPFLPMYAWTGIWSGLLLIVLALCDFSAVMRYFTRFTDEIFASLIAFIFIVEAISSLLSPFASKEPPAVALLTLILGLGTFLLAHSLRAFQRSRYLWRSVRLLISDFGPSIAIILMTAFAVYEANVPVQSPKIPAQLVPTSPRTWFIDLTLLPLWAIGTSFGVALMVTTLLFLDQNITTRLVNAKGNKLRKGAGFHLDLLVVGLITIGCSLFAFPWIVAATVHSLNHVRSLAHTSVKGPDGQKIEVIDSVIENRVSPLCIHIFIGCSVLLLPLMQLVPMAVLFGLFLFMGTATLAGNQFFDRLTLWVTDPSLYPPSHYVQRVAHWRMHIYTAIQGVALAALWALKASPLGLLFPLLIAILAPLRMILPRFFSAEELAALDADEEADEHSDVMLGEASG